MFVAPIKSWRLRALGAALSVRELGSRGGRSRARSNERLWGYRDNPGRGLLVLSANGGDTPLTLGGELARLLCQDRRVRTESGEEILRTDENNRAKQYDGSKSVRWRERGREAGTIREVTSTLSGLHGGHALL